jgi:hypothetical protein
MTGRSSPAATKHREGTDVPPSAHALAPRLRASIVGSGDLDAQVKGARRSLAWVIA